MRDKKKRFTDNELSILLLLIDGKGWPQWEIVEKLGFCKSDVSKYMSKLRKDGVVTREFRDTTRPSSANPNQQEWPYYILIDIDIFQLILRDIARNIVKIEELMENDLEDLDESPGEDDEAIAGYRSIESYWEDLNQYYWGILLKLIHSKYTSQIIDRYGTIRVGSVLLYLGKDQAISLIDSLVKIGTVDKDDHQAYLDYINENGRYAGLIPGLTKILLLL